MTGDTEGICPWCHRLVPAGERCDHAAYQITLGLKDAEFLAHLTDVLLRCGMPSCRAVFNEHAPVPVGTAAVREWMAKTARDLKKRR